MARQIDLQRSDGREPFCNGVKVRARPCVLSGTRISHPVDVAAARILGLDDGLGAVPAAEARHLDAAQLPVRQIRHIDVEDHRPLLRALQRILRHSPHELRRHLARRRRKLRGLSGVRHSDTAMAGNPRNRPSTAAATVPEYSVSSPRLAPSLTPDTTMSCSKSNNPEIARCTQSVGVPLTIVSIGVVPRGAHRHIEGQRIARSAAIAVRSHDGDGAQWLDRPPECRQALGSVAVVIGKKDLQLIHSLRRAGGCRRADYTVTLETGIRRSLRSMGKKNTDAGADASEFRAAVRDVKPLAQPPPVAGMATPKPHRASAQAAKRHGGKSR